MNSNMSSRGSIAYETSDVRPILGFNIAPPQRLLVQVSRDFPYTMEYVAPRPSAAHGDQPNVVRYGDNEHKTRTPMQPGVWLSHEDEAYLCNYGWHFHREPASAVEHWFAVELRNTLYASLYHGGVYGEKDVYDHDFKLVAKDRLLLAEWVGGETGQSAIRESMIDASLIHILDHIATTINTVMFRRSRVWAFSGQSFRFIIDDLMNLILADTSINVDHQTRSLFDNLTNRAIALIAQSSQEMPLSVDFGTILSDGIRTVTAALDNVYTASSVHESPFEPQHVVEFGLIDQANVSRPGAFNDNREAGQIINDEIYVSGMALAIMLRRVAAQLRRSLRNPVSYDVAASDDHVLQRELANTRQMGGFHAISRLLASSISPSRDNHEMTNAVNGVFRQGMSHLIDTVWHHRTDDAYVRQVDGGVECWGWLVYDPAVTYIRERRNEDFYGPL